MRGYSRLAVVLWGFFGVGSVWAEADLGTVDPWSEYQQAERAHRLHLQAPLAAPLPETPALDLGGTVSERAAAQTQAWMVARLRSPAMPLEYTARHRGSPEHMPWTAPALVERFWDLKTVDAVRAWIQYAFWPFSARFDWADLAPPYAGERVPAARHAAATQVIQALRLGAPVYSWMHLLEARRVIPAPATGSDAASDPEATVEAIAALLGAETQLQQQRLAEAYAAYLQAERITLLIATQGSWQIQRTSALRTILAQAGSS